MRAEGGRILPPKNSPTKAHDSHFLTRTCHQHPAPTLSPTPWSAPPCGSFIVKVKWSRSALGSTYFSVLVIMCSGFLTAPGVAGSKFWLGPFYTARLSFTQLLAKEASGAGGRSLERVSATRANTADFERSPRADFKDRSHILPVPSAELGHSPCRSQRGARQPTCARQSALACGSLHTWRSGPRPRSWIVRTEPMSSPGERSALPARADWSHDRRGRAGGQQLRAAARARREWEWRGRPPPPCPSPPRSLPLSLPPSLPPRTPRLWPRAGGAPHCTLWGRRSVRGMGQRAAAGGRNPRAARVSRGGLPGRTQKELGLVPAAQANVGPGPSTEWLESLELPRARTVLPPAPRSWPAELGSSPLHPAPVFCPGAGSSTVRSLEGRVCACVFCWRAGGEMEMSEAAKFNAG